MAAFSAATREPSVPRTSAGPKPMAATRGSSARLPAQEAWISRAPAARNRPTFAGVIPDPGRMPMRPAARAISRAISGSPSSAGPARPR